MADDRGSEGEGQGRAAGLLEQAVRPCGDPKSGRSSPYRYSTAKATMRPAQRSRDSVCGVAGPPQLRGPSWRCTVVPNTTRGGGAVSQHDGHKRSEALARLGE